MLIRGTNRLRYLCVVLLFCLLGLSSTPAAATSYMAIDRQGHTLVGSSIGFGVVGGEASFLTTLEADYFTLHNWTLGGQMLFSVNELFVWGTQAVGKFYIDLESDELWVNALKPYGQALIGLVLTTNGDTDVGFLGGFGFGSDYYLTSRLALGTNFLFQFSNELADEHFGFFWKVITAKYLF